MRRSASARVSAASCLLVVALGLGGCSGEGASLDPAAPAFPVGDVELVRDDRGMVHVFATRDDDAMFGAGYATARDRLLQMELSRRQARGTRAELLGESAYDDDVRSRMIGFARLGEADLAHAQNERPADVDLLVAWVAGVNRWLGEVRRGEVPRPFGFDAAGFDFVPEDWSPADAFAVGKLLGFGLSESLDSTLLASALVTLAPDTSNALRLLAPAFEALPAGEPSTVEPLLSPGGPAPPLPTDVLAELGVKPTPFAPSLAPIRGSNNWAVAGEHTENGRPLLAGDPHLSHEAPPRLYPIHLTSLAEGGSLDVAGFTFPGTGPVELGVTTSVAWTATVNFADAMDVYDVPANATQAIVGGEPVPIVRRTETIRVRGEGAPPFDGDDREVTFDDVPGWGVLLPDELLPVPPALLGVEGRMLFTWTGFAPTLDGSAYLAMGRAQTVDEHADAVSLLEVGAMNFVAADANDIRYSVHATLPDRGDPSAYPMPWRVVPGEHADVTWAGPSLAADRFPGARNPERGFVATANNDPLGFTFDGSVENDAWYYGAFYDPGFRAHRASTELARLVGEGAVTREHMQALQTDARSPVADVLVPALVLALDAIGTDPALAEFEERSDLVALGSRLALWDRAFSRESSAAVLFTAVEWFAAKRALEGPVTPTLFDAVAGGSSPFLLGALVKVLTGKVATPALFAPKGTAHLLLSALDDARAWADEEFGSVDAIPTLSDFSFVRFRSQTGGAQALPQRSAEGAGDTLNVAESTFLKDGKGRDRVVTGSGAVYRMVVGFDEQGVAVPSVAYSGGASEDPASPWFASELKGWLEGAYAPMWVRRSDVEAHATERSTLVGR